jgi:acetyl/propionyl-CoA carboxylase alpha subunit
VPSARQVVEYRHGDGTVTVTYRCTRDGVVVAVDGAELDGVVWRASEPEVVDLEVAGVRRRVRVHAVDDVTWVDSALGADELVEVPRFTDPAERAAAGSLLAPMPGTVVRVAVADGAEVAAGAPIVVLEAMKMEHTVTAPHDGVVRDLDLVTGQTVDTGAVLAVVEAAVESAEAREPT